ncbi:LacI family DNA-binding transcriptional regulator [Flavisolibacter tropicus]|uniref:LacI family transcriptional regulator n=1 Tax=Flavisolibacter tropicus TaxID=1492898 RepID=A0A172TRD9_9BACT|nr:LacI family DNA-binding transcriptional regulator [Flavisolibacter tropicus]ANE49649.1 LacI family transcriptional regulator [Flavisolibacter tropicus]
MSTVNLKQLAKELNLSVSTVSKAFKNSYDISEATRERILTRAKQLNYQPNPYAAGLRTQRSQTIAVVIPEIANNFFVQAINGIETVAQGMGYHVMIYLTHEDQSKEQAFLQHLQNGRVDAILLSLSSGKDHAQQLKELQKRDIPIVLFDRIDTQVDAIKIQTDNIESSYKATTHLIEAGCKKIAHLTLSEKLAISNDRLEGYKRALKDAGLKFKKELVVDCSLTKNNEDQIVQLLQKLRPDGLFSGFEKLALQTYQVCEKLNVNIPNDLKLISFSNLPIAELLNPGLSVVVQPAFEIGKVAAEMIFELLKIKGSNRIKTITIPSHLIKRKSTGN